jgi:cob(I)alamin adenosyltransferase
MTETTPEERHKKRMQRKKEVVDAHIAAATEDRGVVVLITGNGKGKSSSGFGMVIRTLGHGYKAAVVQFIKGAMDCGEHSFLQKHCLQTENTDLEFHVMGTGFTWETQDKSVDIAAAQTLWTQAQRLLRDDSVQLVLLDEMTYMLKYGYLPCDEVIAAIRSRPAHQHVVINGRGAPDALYDIADTVSDIRDEKHAFRAGVRAQKGVEW